jgi:hypothetical protein
MPLRTEPRGFAGYPTPLNVILLGSAGLALLGAGAFLAFQSGSLVSVRDTVLVAIASCL